MGALDLVIIGVLILGGIYVFSTIQNTNLGGGLGALFTGIGAQGPRSKYVEADYY